MEQQIITEDIKISAFLQYFQLFPSCLNKLHDQIDLYSSEYLLEFLAEIQGVEGFYLNSFNEKPITKQDEISNLLKINDILLKNQTNHCQEIKKNINVEKIMNQSSKIDLLQLIQKIFQLAVCSLNQNYFIEKIIDLDLKYQKILAILIKDILLKKSPQQNESIHEKINNSFLSQRSKGIIEKQYLKEQKNQIEVELIDKIYQLEQDNQNIQLNNLQIKKNNQQYLQQLNIKNQQIHTINQQNKKLKLQIIQLENHYQLQKKYMKINNDHNRIQKYYTNEINQRIQIITNNFQRQKQQYTIFWKQKYQQLVLILQQKQQQIDSLIISRTDLVEELQTIENKKIKQISQRQLIIAELQNKIISLEQTCNLNRFEIWKQKVQIEELKKTISQQTEILSNHDNIYENQNYVRSSLTQRSYHDFFETNMSRFGGKKSDFLGDGNFNEETHYNLIQFKKLKQNYQKQQFYLKTKINSLKKQMNKHKQSKKKIKQLQYDRKKLHATLMEYENTRGQQNQILMGCIYQLRMKLNTKKNIIVQQNINLLKNQNLQYIPTVNYNSNHHLFQNLKI